MADPRLAVLAEPELPVQTSSHPSAVGLCPQTAHPWSHVGDGGHGMWHRWHRNASVSDAEHPLNRLSPCWWKSPTPPTDFGGCSAPCPHTPAMPGTYRQSRRVQCARSGGSCGTTATLLPGWPPGCCCTAPRPGSCRGSAGSQARLIRGKITGLVLEGQQGCTPPPRGGAPQRAPRCLHPPSPERNSLTQRI